MRDFTRRLYAAFTNRGPGYDLPTRTETDLRTTLATLADRWEQIAGPKPDPCSSTRPAPPRPRGSSTTTRCAPPQPTFAKCCAPGESRTRS